MEEVKVFNGKEFYLVDGYYRSGWQLLETPAGYYLGSTLLIADEMEMPFQRYTGYFQNKEDGESILEELHPSSL